MYIWKKTIYQQACNQVEGFQAISETFYHRLVIDGKSKSTHQNYLRQISKLALFYQKSPLEITQVELEEYLFHLIVHDTASESSFKHLIFGLRKMYALFEKEELLIKLPKLNRDKKLPVVLSTTEIRKLLCAPNNLYQRVLFGVIYDTGMRISEVRSLLPKLSDSWKR